MSITMKDFQPFLIRSEKTTKVLFDSNEERVRMHFNNMFPGEEVVEIRHATNNEIAEYSSKKKEAK